MFNNITIVLINNKKGGLEIKNILILDTIYEYVLRIENVSYWKVKNTCLRLVYRHLRIFKCGKWFEAEKRSWKEIIRKGWDYRRIRNTWHVPNRVERNWGRVNYRSIYSPKHAVWYLFISSNSEHNKLQIDPIFINYYSHFRFKLSWTIQASSSCVPTYQHFIIFIFIVSSHASYFNL